MRIVVTGASGNVGTALLRRLAGTDASLIGIARRTPPDVDAYAGVEWVSLDVGALDATERLTSVFAGADAVVHLAWLIQPGRDRELLRRTNQGGTRAVIAAAQAAGIGQLVHTSSVGAYAAAPGHPWVDETWPATGVPSSSYSVDKAAAEAMLDAAESREGFPITARVRPALVLQPDAASEISRYFLGHAGPTALLKPSLLRWTPWPSGLRVQFVHADDVADAIARIVERRAAGAFNLAGDPVIDRDALREAVGGIGPAVPIRALRVAADVSFKAHVQPTDAGWIDLAASVPLMKTDRARSELDWQPTHAADATLVQFVQAIHEGRGASGPLLYPRGEEP